MAKAVTIKVKLVSSADTGFYYVAKKNSRTMTDKLVKKKYDPVARKHVEFREVQDQVSFRASADDNGPLRARFSLSWRLTQTFQSPERRCPANAVAQSCNLSPHRCITMPASAPTNNSRQALDWMKNPGKRFSTAWL